MYTLVKKEDANARQVSDTKVVHNFITKDISPGVSLAVVENNGNFGEVTAMQNYCYYVIEGVLELTFDGEVVQISAGDACLVEQGTTYNFAGDCKAVVVNHPAYGTNL